MIAIISTFSPEDMMMSEIDVDSATWISGCQVNCSERLRNVGSAGNGTIILPYVPRKST